VDLAIAERGASNLLPSAITLTFPVLSNVLLVRFMMMDLDPGFFVSGMIRKGS